MKRKELVILLIVISTMTACGKMDEAVTDGDSSKDTEIIQQENAIEQSIDEKNTNSTGNDEASNEYAGLIKSYETALSESWGGGKLMENNMNFMMADCYGSNPFEQIGYWIGDIDSDGTSEFVVGTTATVTDDFYGKLIFDCYTLDENGSCMKVFGSEERNRYYYAGDNMFVNIGSSGATDSFETIVKYEAGELSADSSVALPPEFVQMEFQKFE